MSPHVSSPSADRPGRLTGRRILLTGASSGVGLAAVERFAAEGARLVLLSRRTEDLRDHLRVTGVDAEVLSVDLTDRDAVQEAVRHAVEHLGGLDVVVSNAGAAVFGNVMEVHPDDFDRTVAVTFTGAVDVVRAALPHLRESRGTVVATGSLMTRVPLPTWSAYSAAKHALRGFLNTLAVEERERGSGVRISMVHPGPIDTPLFAGASSSTGHKPRVPPDSYRAEVVAQALVEATVRPRREVVLGGETLAIDVLYRAVRPVAELVLVGIARWYRSGDEDAPTPGTLWDVRGIPGEVSGGIPSRDSLLAPLQLGPRMLPSPATPLRLARNLAAAGVRAAQLSTQLLSPGPERPAPSAPLRGAEPEPAERPTTVQV